MWMHLLKLECHSGIWFCQDHPKIWMKCNVILFTAKIQMNQLFHCIVLTRFTFLAKRTMILRLPTSNPCNLSMAFAADFDWNKIEIKFIIHFFALHYLIHWHFTYFQVCYKRISFRLANVWASFVENHVKLVNSTAFLHDFQ